MHHFWFFLSPKKSNYGYCIHLFVIFLLSSILSIFYPFPTLAVPFLLLNVIWFRFVFTVSCNFYFNLRLKKTFEIKYYILWLMNSSVFILIPQFMIFFGFADPNINDLPIRMLDIARKHGKTMNKVNIYSQYR